MGEISQGVYVTPALNAAACSLLSSYTLISILDHERWMKEWGDEHEAVAVMHLRTPILSAAVAMGIGGITTVHQVALSSLRLDGEIELGGNVLCTCLAAVTGITTMFAMLYVARKDTFGGVDRVERLKEVILKRHTIAELKLKKGLGKKAAYLGQLQHIVAAGTILAMGILGCWALNVLGLTGEFMVVWRTSGIVVLAFYLLVTSIVSCWLLFRVLVWKPSYEYLRPLCSVVFAISLWSADLLQRGSIDCHVCVQAVGKTIAITFEYTGDGLGRVGLGWSVGASRDGGEWLMIMMAFGAVMTQYAIALELRLAYCGLQDTNLDLQLLAGTGAPEEHIRKTSAIKNNTSKRRHTGQGGRTGNTGSRSPPARSRRRSVVVHASAAASFASPTMNLTRTFSPGSTGGGDGLAKHPAHLSASAGVVSALLRMGQKSIGLPTKSSQSRSIRVQPAMDCSKVLVYEPSVAEDPEEDNNHPHPLLPSLRHPTHKPPPVESPPRQASASSVEGGRWARRPTSDGRGSPPPVAVDYSSCSAL
ncbi:hypothetical protein Esi_0181_0025 [Ectocarpus siliculosus]|uniref:Uncharacterized protein n=1 Tax=Ectocarpus siliculosus TaxID=2880 RepID=D8LGU3_ECTSI|nr:hypothetical protein Esi_0181_0025 [Ectocarpus siliculosus]|eukprot:CBN75796.1 hypothetical protein Esi_0181_0025 [Ectocarpus siliculosus]